MIKYIHKKKFYNKNYFKEYLVPMLNELNDKKVITYDVNSNDKEI